MPIPEDIAHYVMSPARRRRETAAILAKAVLSHRRAAKVGACPAGRESCDSPQNRLGPTGASKLPVPTGSDSYDPRYREKER